MEDQSKGLIKIKRALISVSDKTEIVPFAQTLQEFGCEIISTGGTKKTLEEANVEVTDISKVTGNLEAFGGRVKTISFQIESALLFDREKDREEADKLGIGPIDLVVCNFYPFKKAKEKNADLETLVENIDIGGPTMVRSAAKNYKYVTIVVDTTDYKKIIEELRENNGALTIQTRYHLMRKTFDYTADYDALISTTMAERVGETSLRFAFDKAKTLRYGENSHQSGLFLRSRTKEGSLYDMNVLHGKELSFNNIVDIYSALDAVRDLKRNGCAVIKHTNPCGLCEGNDQRKTFEYAWAGDPISAFGSVVAFNSEVKKETAEFLELHNEDKSKRKFVEVVIAPSFTKNAKDYLFIHKNLRVVEFDPAKLHPRKDIKFLYNSLLYQDVDRELRKGIEFVTESKSEIKESLIDFGLIAVRQLKSNAIVVVREIGDGYFQLLGMGCGQPNRVVSVKLALDKCAENLKNEFEGSETEFNDYMKGELKKSLLVSDAFFPFPDNVEVAASYGIRTIIQPGGSIRDKEVIDRCSELGISMAFTGLRHFKH